jgi:hypothetical protein
MEVMKQSSHHVNPLSQRETNFRDKVETKAKTGRRKKIPELLLSGSVGESEAEILVWECYCACECVTVVFPI